MRLKSSEPLRSGHGSSRNGKKITGRKRISRKSILPPERRTKGYGQQKSHRIAAQNNKRDRGKEKFFRVESHLVRKERSHQVKIIKPRNVLLTAEGGS